MNASDNMRKNRLGNWKRVQVNRSESCCSQTEYAGFTLSRVWSSSLRYRGGIVGFTSHHKLLKLVSFDYSFYSEILLIKRQAWLSIDVKMFLVRKPWKLIESSSDTMLEMVREKREKEITENWFYPILFFLIIEFQ